MAPLTEQELSELEVQLRSRRALSSELEELCKEYDAECEWWWWWL